MKQQLTIRDFISCVPWEQIEDRMGKREYKKFLKWMSGQTCLKQGVYEGDLDRYLKGLPVID
jgi:hypothetical protein